jgi:hypothetical protein
MRMAEISTTPLAGNFMKMMRYEPTVFRMRPFHSGQPFPNIAREPG